jgi:hypothetical protein
MLTAGSILSTRAPCLLSSLKATALKLQEEFTCVQANDVKYATAEELSVYINRNNPTLVVTNQPSRCLPAFYSAPTFSKVNSKFILEGKSNINIVCIPSATDFIHKVSEGSYQIDAGIITKEDGSILYGIFDNPIKIDIAAFDDDDRTTDIYDIPRVNERNAGRLTRDKYLQKKVFDDLGFSFAPFLPRSDKPPEDISTALKEQGINYFDELVVKPFDGRSGYGISFLTSREIASAWRYDTLCEKKIESFYLFDANGERVDWNLRVLISNGNILGTFVRFSTDKGPVNVFQGADVAEWCISFFERFGIPVVVAEFIKDTVDTKILKIAEQLKTLDLGYCGVDILVDNQIAANVLEVNGIRSGGIELLFEQDPSRIEPISEVLMDLIAQLAVSK